MRPAFVFGLVLGLAGAGGCSGDSGMGTVEGEVLLDGKPLKEGIIKFEPADGRSQTADALIVDGRFRATMPVGEKRVQISAPKVIKKQKMFDTPDSKLVEVTAELLPDRYNVRSELKMTVERGTQEKRFEVQGK